MKRNLAVLTFVLFLAQGARAATLAELNGPLLNKGQWRLDASAALSRLSYQYKTFNVSDTGAKSGYSYTGLALAPAATYGLTGALQLKAAEVYSLPYSYETTAFEVPGAAMSTTEMKLKFRSALTGSLTWRPGAPWELRCSASRADSGLSASRASLPLGSGTTQDSQGQNRLQNFSAAGTWLSAPKAGRLSSDNRPDLDGLYGPLLDKGQARADLGLSYGKNFSRTHDQSLNLANGRRTLRRATSESYLLTVSPSFRYGVLALLQAEAGADLAVPRPSYDLSRSHQLSINGAVQRGASSANRSEVLASWAPRLKLTHRFSPQLQTYLRGSYAYAKNRQKNRSVDETDWSVDTLSRVSGSESASAAAGLNWITRPRREGRPLAADLDGLDRPLLEQAQFQLDLELNSSRSRSWEAGAGSDSIAYNGLSSRLAYGVTPELQAYASLAATPRYTIYGASAQYVYPWNPTYGAGAAWRPSQAFQLYADASYNPAVNKSKAFAADGSVSATSRTDSDSTSITLGAVFLW